MAETLFGSTITISTGRVIPVRWIGERHVREDLGFIPSFADWVKAIRPEPWMGRAVKLPEGKPVDLTRRYCLNWDREGGLCRRKQP
jgi:hypothetical protein